MKPGFTPPFDAGGEPGPRRPPHAGMGWRPRTLAPPAPWAALRAGLRAVLAGSGRAIAAWRSITRREALVALAVALCSALLGVLTSLEEMHLHAPLPVLLRSLALFAIDPLPAAAIGLLAWSVADRAPAGARRGPRLVAAVIVTAALYALLLPAVLLWGLDIRELCDLSDCTDMPELQHASIWLVSASAGASVLVFGGAIFALTELRRRIRAVDDARAATLRDRCRLQHETLATRLAAMQAQVEPQFLFESLVDIERLYAADPAHGERTLDRLIVFLRTALPRLQETGSTVGAEVRLVAAWLALVAERNDGTPRFTATVAPGCAAALMYPMLLLPLVQRAASGCARIATAVTLEIVRDGAACTAHLQIAGGRCCPEDAEVARVRERLIELCGPEGCLTGSAGTGPDSTEYRLTWPHEIAEDPGDDVPHGALTHGKDAHGEDPPWRRPTS